MKTISFAQGLGHLKHAVEAIESQELKAHLKTTGILFQRCNHPCPFLNPLIPL